MVDLYDYHLIDDLSYIQDVAKYRAINLYQLSSAKDTSNRNTRASLAVVSAPSTLSNQNLKIQVITIIHSS